MTAVRLRLYVAGRSARSEAAVNDLERLVVDVIGPDADVEIVDVLERPDVAESSRILVTPTLDKILPFPTRRIIGDLSDTDAVLKGLGLRPREESGAP